MSLSEADLILRVSEDSGRVKAISPTEQTEAICLAAVQRNGHILKVIGQQTLDICISAIQEDQDALRYVKLPVDALPDPHSGQIEDWLTVLRACQGIEYEAYRDTLWPLMTAVPLGRQYQDDWAQMKKDGRCMLDELQVLASEMKCGA